MDERQRELRRLHQETWIKVKKAVDDADPEGLLAMGAPTDEYDDAVAELTRRLLKGEAVDERGIAAWFAATYGLAPSRGWRSGDEARGHKAPQPGHDEA